MKKIILLIVSTLLKINSFGQSTQFKVDKTILNPLEFKNRDKKLSEEEKIILVKTGLSEDKFRATFSEIIISEIIMNSIYVSRATRKEKNGLLFYGITINLKDYLQLKYEFKKIGLELEVSLNTPSDRWRDFKFPFYKDLQTVVDFEKQIYKIYRSSEVIEFIDQIDYINQDKSIIEKVYEDWKKNLNIMPIWADNKDNILLVDCEITEIIVEKIFEGYRRCYPNIDRNINLGWETKESKMKEIKNRLPFIEMSFYDD